MASRPSLVVLGAGATRGASFAESGSRLHLPPLDSDFFRLLARSPAGKSAQARALIEYVQKNHSPTLDVSMEAVFVELEGSAEFYEQFNIGRGRILREPRKTIRHFYRVLPGVLRHSVDDACSYHQALAAKLESGDAVISFNYDCLMDEALKTDGRRRWSPETGYGFSPSTGADEWRQWGPGPPAAEPIKLLKLHGSLNWDCAGNDVRLIASPYERDSAEYAVVPPLGRKPVSTEPYLSVWRRARAAVRSAERLIVVGYSLPPADYLARALLRADLDNDKLREVIIVDPSSAVADRFVQLLTKIPKRIELFTCFRAFADWLEEPS